MVKLDHGWSAVEYYATVSKSPLQELSPEEEQESIAYLEEHSAHCLEMMHKLLNYDFYYEIKELRATIQQLGENIRDFQKDIKNNQNSRYIDDWFRYIDEDRFKKAALEKRIKEINEEEKQAKEEVAEFKRRVRPVCMSRCRQIERAIDLEYERQLEEFTRKKNDPDIQRKVAKKVSIIDDTRAMEHRYSEEENVIGKLKIKRFNTHWIVDYLDLNCEEIPLSIDDLYSQNYSAIGEYNKLREAIKKLESISVEDMSEEQLDSIQNMISNISNGIPQYDRLNEEYTSEQDDMVLNAIYRKILWHQALQHYNDFSMELEQIESRTFSDKVKDLFKGKAKYKRERASEIRNALEIIKTRIDDLSCNPGSVGEIEPRKLYLELEKLKSIPNHQKEFLERYEEMKYFIMNYYIKRGMVLEESSPVREVALVPSGKRISAADEMRQFLIANGYIRSENDEGRESNSTLTVEVSVRKIDIELSNQKRQNDEFIRLMTACIESINALGQSKSEVQIDNSEQKKEEELKGTGIGFHTIE